MRTFWIVCVLAASACRNDESQNIATDTVEDVIKKDAEPSENTQDEISREDGPKVETKAPDGDLGNTKDVETKDEPIAGPEEQPTREGDVNIAKEFPTDIERAIFVVMPSYNNRDYCVKNIESVLTQKYNNYRVVYVDDGSTDGTGDLVRKKAAELGMSHKVNVITNSVNLGRAMTNIYNAVTKFAREDEIVVLVDGDDRLAHPLVFEKLNRIYANPDVWLTYGAFDYEFEKEIRFGLQEILPNHILRDGRIRSHKWITSHLKTFYAALFKLIKKEDLFYESDFAKVGCDLGFMFPMIEMTSTHVFYNPDVSYFYNRTGEKHDDLINADMQRHMDEYFRGLRPYKALTSLPFQIREHVDKQQSKVEDESGKKYLVVSTYGGMGNRLRALASAHVAAQRLGRRLVVEWHLVEGEMKAELSDLFENDFVKPEEVRLQNGETLAVLLQACSQGCTDVVRLSDPGDVTGLGAEQFIYDDAAQLSGLTQKVIRVRTLFNFKLKEEPFDSYIDELSTFYKNLVPVANVRRKVESFKKAYVTSEMVGVHLRSWSQSRDFSLNPNTGFDELTEKIETILSQHVGTQFFVASDDRKKVEELKRKFGTSIVTFPLVEVARVSVEDQQDALAEWLALGATKYLIATLQSSFSDEAALCTLEKRKINFGEPAYNWFHSIIHFSTDGSPYARPKSRI